MLAAMHASEPALSEADLRKITLRTLIMVADEPGPPGARDRDVPEPA